MNKKIKIICGVVSVSTLLCASASVYAGSLANADEITADEVQTTSTPNDEKNEASINLKDDATSYTGNGVEVSGNIIKITAAGVYDISGSLSDGQIIVDASKEAEVELKLNGVNIKCADGAPIYVKSADETILNLKKGTVNTIEDGTEYNEENINNGVNGAIFSKDDLRIKGSGTLNVTGNYNNGIVSKDDIKIKNGNINVTAKNNGIKGKDSIQYEDAVLTINAGNDGMKSDNDEDENKGYISITSGEINIISDADAIQAENYVDISGGKFNLVSGNGSDNSTKIHTDSFMGGKMPSGQNNVSVENDEESTSCKGIKAGNSITITDGEFYIDSADDGIHTNDTIELNGGSYKILSGDDGIHADSNLTISKGNVDVQKSYEGLEAANITINDGQIQVKSSDDGINASEKNETSDNQENGFNPGGMTAGNAILTINGGTVYVNADGDGLDSNGSIEMNGGTVLVDGPTSNGDGALDYDRTFNINGGTLIAAGSSGMAQAPSTSSIQNCVKVTTGNQNANTLFNIKDSEGNDIVTYSPSKNYASVIVSSPDLVKGNSYSINIGGQVDGGTETNGLYMDGKYSGGTLFKDFTISSVITNVTSQGVTEGSDDMGNGFMPGQGGHNRPEGMGTDTPGPNGRPNRPENAGTDTPWGDKIPGDMDPNDPNRPPIPEGMDQNDPDSMQRPEDFSTDTPSPNEDASKNEQGNNESSDQNNESQSTSDSAKVITVLLFASSLIILNMKKIINRLKINK